MKPEEKAKELVRKFELRFDVIDDENFSSMVGKDEAKQCALICVDEIIKTKPNNLVEVTENNRSIISEFKWNVNYWEEVKQEINKL